MAITLTNSATITTTRNFEEIVCKFRHKVSAFCLSSMCTNLLCQYRHSDNQIMTKDIVGNEEYGEILQTSTPVKYYPDCKECMDKYDNCVKCIIWNIRETDDSDSNSPCSPSLDILDDM